VTARAGLALLTGCLLATGMTLLIWDPGRPQLYGLLLGAAAGTGIIALLARPAAPDAPREISDDSVTTLIATAGALMILLGIAVGLWLVLIGAGVLAGGLAGVLRELRAGRASA
jgi:hypothetical protein